MKKCSRSPADGEMQITTSVSYYLTPVTMAFLKKAKNNTVQTWRKGNPCALSVGMELGAATVLEVLQSAETDPAVSLLGVYLKKMKH